MLSASTFSRTQGPFLQPRRFPRVFVCSSCPWVRDVVLALEDFKLAVLGLICLLLSENFRTSSSGFVHVFPSLREACQLSVFGISEANFCCSDVKLPIIKARPFFDRLPYYRKLARRQEAVFTGGGRRKVKDRLS